MGKEGYDEIISTISRCVLKIVIVLLGLYFGIIGHHELQPCKYKGSTIKKGSSTQQTNRRSAQNLALSESFSNFEKVLITITFLSTYLKFVVTILC